MKIYCVTKGEYSEYGIFAMFSTMETAQQCIDDAKTIDSGYGGVNDDIEEWELDSIEPLKGRKPFEVKMDWESGNGKATPCDSLYDMERMNKAEVTDISLWHPSNRASYMTSGKCFRTYVLADDEAHAIKIASERRAMERAK